MFTWFTSTIEVLVLIPVALAASWVARRTIRSLVRRSVRRAKESQGSWRVRLDRLGDDGQADVRKRQRADATARMLGHAVTVVIFTMALLVSLDVLGVDLVWAISSAGFIGVALALSGQDLIKDYLAGTRALLEDRYAVGDEVVLRVDGTDVSGTVDLLGTASVRLRTPDGATWHAGHHSVESVTNLSQMPAITKIPVVADDWSSADEASAGDRLADASDDHGLTGVVFMRDIETHSSETGTIDVIVKTNRPLSADQSDLVRTRLLDH